MGGIIISVLYEQVRSISYLTVSLPDISSKIQCKHERKEGFFINLLERSNGEWYIGSIVVHALQRFSHDGWVNLILVGGANNDIIIIIK